MRGDDVAHGRDVAQLRDLMDERDRRYLEVATAQARAVDAAFASAKEAVLKAEVASEKRFEAVNEFRAQLSDQAATFMPRAEAEAASKSISERLQLQIDGNAAQIAALVGTRLGGVAELRATLFASIAALAAIVSIVLGVVLAVTR